ncbi:MAG: ferredoxin--NADP reductase [Methanohalobium sp.]|uniref:ferredoxin--NADP reductase n=1 Tax=Methanohalobium sp. TaxID=2837493 RepID=UPI00397B6B3C
MEFSEPITKIMQQTPDVKSFRFNRPESFDYKAGQYILVTIPVGEEMVRKPFTLSSSPTEKDHLEFTKKLTGHEYSNVLDSTDTGDILKIDGPYGKMTFEGEYDKIALLSGGIGVTPMISICKYCTDLKLDTMVTLVSSNKTEEDIVFRDELENLENQNKYLKVVFTLTRASSEWQGCREYICENLITREIPDFKDYLYYLCGPPGMVKSVESMLENLEIPDERIKKELFTGY